MSLHLISVLLDTAKEITSTMDVEHDSVALAIGTFSFIVIGTHLDPFCFQGTGASPPLPPLPATHLLYAVFAKVCYDGVCGFGHMLVGDCDILSAHPWRVRHYIGSKRLDVVDSLTRSIFEEGADQV